MNESARSCKKKKSCLKGSSYELNMSNYATAQKRFKNKPSLPPTGPPSVTQSRQKSLTSEKRAQLIGERGHGEQIPGGCCRIMSISALLLAHPAIPAAHFPEPQRTFAWCAPGHSVPITTRVGQENDPYGSVNIELNTKGQHAPTMANGLPSLFSSLWPCCCMFQYSWSSTVIFPSG